MCVYTQYISLLVWIIFFFFFKSRINVQKKCANPSYEIQFNGMLITFLVCFYVFCLQKNLLRWNHNITSLLRQCIQLILLLLFTVSCLSKLSTRHKFMLENRKWKSQDIFFLISFFKQLHFILWAFSFIFSVYTNIGCL